MKSRPPFLSLSDGDSFGRGFTAVDALRDAHAMIGVAGQGEAGVLSSSGFNLGDPLQMADMVLRHRGWPAGDVGPLWDSIDLHQRGELAVGYLFELIGR